MRALACVFLLACSSAETPADGGMDSPDDSPSLDGGDEPEAAPIDSGVDPIISRDPGESGFEGETEVAVASDGTICAVWIATDYLATPGFSRIGYRFSRNQGATWSPIRYVSKKSDDPTVDPSIAADAQGNFWIEYISLAYPNNVPGDGHVMVAKAPKGSDTFGAGVEASDPNGAMKFRDHAKIAVTKTGTIALAWLEATSYADFSGPGIVARSSDGMAWSRSVAHQPPTKNDFANLYFLCAADTTSRLYATYFEYLSGGGVRIPLRWSDDEGATWSQPTLASAVMPMQVGGVDPTCVARGDEVWIAYGVSNLAPPSMTSSQPMQGLRVAHSPDRGATIDTRIDATDKASGKVFLHPTLARDEKGELELVFYAGQKDKDPAGSWRFSRTQGGAFQPSQSVATLTFLLERQTTLWLGDYTGIAVRGNQLYTTYADNSDGANSHIAFQRVSVF